MIELLLVMVVLGLCLSVIAYPMRHAFEEWRYRRSLEEFSQTLLQAQFLSICYGTDCYVLLEKNRDGSIDFLLESLEPLTKQIKKRHPFYGVKKVAHGEDGLSRIAFYASGFHKPQDKIVIFPSKKSLSKAHVEMTAPYSFSTDIPQSMQSEDRD